MEALFEKFQTYWKNNGFEEEFENIIQTNKEKSLEQDSKLIVFLEKHINQFCFVNEISVSNTLLIRLIIINAILS